MEARSFVNFYEVLEVDPGAGLGVIEHRFRELARRYHPDNLSTGDRVRFDAIVEAHEALRDEKKRAHYHDQNSHHLPPFMQSFGEGAAEAEVENGEDARRREAIGDDIGIERDISVQNNILTMLYQRRRRNIREPGIGDAELEHLTGCPHEHLEFHIWYMREKGWIATQEDGLLAITIGGVDRAAAIYRESANRLITDQS